MQESLAELSELDFFAALESVIDQYQMSTNQRSGITNDPNRPDNSESIVRLLGQIITVSLETVKGVKGLAGCEIWVTLFPSACDGKRQTNQSSRIL